MTNLLTQIRNLSDAGDCIQDAINLSTNDVAKGKMYAMQDMLTCQIKVLLAQESAQKDNNNDAWDNAVATPVQLTSSL